MWAKSAAPASASASSAAWSVTVWSVFQFDDVNVSEAPVFTLRLVSCTPVVDRATLTVTSLEGRVASFTL